MAVSLIAVDCSRPIQSLFLQEPRVGTVHSVFNKATNIIFDEILLSLLSDELPRMPNSVRLRSDVIDELLSNLQPGMETHIGYGSLIIPNCNFSFHLTEIPLWEPRPDVTIYQWNRETVAQHSRLLTQFLAKKQDQNGLAHLVGSLLLENSPQETPLSRMAVPKLRLLVQASWRQNIAGIEEATLGLAGLGPGLTPSGDDALGAFAAIMALLSPQLSVDFISRKYIASTIAKMAKSRTTKLSAVLLEFAAQGEVSEQFGTLLLSLNLPVGEFEIVQKAAEGVLAFGASSGGDCLLGMLLGLRALDGEIE